MSIMHAKLHGFSEYIRQQMEQWKVPGLSIAVIQGQQIVMAEGFGLRNVEQGLEVTPETLFAIGSCTKAFTAMSAGMLVDEGKLDWDRPVKEYLPNFKLYDSIATERITIRDMLCHRSGLPRHDLMWYNAPFTREEIIERLQYLEPNHDFRSKWQYNNLMYMAAGYLVGQLAGVPWEQWVQERIFAPLRMDNSNFSIDEMERHPNAAVPYIDKDNQVQATAYRNLDVIGPAGSINSNVMEMANWVLLQLNQGTFQGQQLVTEGSIATMHTPQMPCGSSHFWKKELPICTYGLGCALKRIGAISWFIMMAELTDFLLSSLFCRRRTSVSSF
ncbi:serine hydrolase domain-containing protein [Paenibacillus dendritiformis]|uniref:serine hydrolase domain-containing protein n=1 Tax=Paenibacillus dendritiformis TaxID=130049 RepID=UPI001FD55C4D|nr:serine hydrolase domain-containing protein [Paenibacillus dendritiformis]